MEAYSQTLCSIAGRIAGISPEETMGRLRVTVAEERVQMSHWNMEKIVEIRGLARLECVVGD